MESNMLLETYLKQLRLPAVLQNYRKFAEDGARANLSYDRYLLALAEQEVAQREKNRQQRRIKAARFPVLKDLADLRLLGRARPQQGPRARPGPRRVHRQARADLDGRQSRRWENHIRHRLGRGGVSPGLPRCASTTRPAWSTT